AFFCSAKERGAAVKVIIDESQSINHNAYNRLKQKGVEVYFDTALKVLHAKAIIVDSKICIVGSHNWTRAALNDNYEFAAYIEDTKLAEKLIDDIAKIPLSSEQTTKPKEQIGLRLPVKMLTALPKPSLFKIFTSQAEQAFDLYLFLAKKAQEINSNVITIDYEEFASKGLGYFKKERIDIYRVLRNLDKKYGVIRYEPGAKTLTVIEIPADEYVNIPDSYWKYGFDRKLTLAAKYMYLISLSEAQRSALNPYWFRSYKDLVRMYHLSEMSIGNGITELQKENILEIFRSKPEKAGKFESRPANRYCLHHLQSLEQFNQGLNVLFVKYGEFFVRQAQELSAQLNEPNDLAKIETYIDLINTYGYEKVKKVNVKVAAYRRETGFYDLAQVILLLKSS
ncbi:MAG: phospholipase D-like domain-containing protein, partial [Candidatus Omnitrophota bacterium]